jgi:hypothetical protein
VLLRAPPVLGEFLPINAPMREEPGVFGSHHGVREVLVTDTVAVREQDWPQLHVASIAALLAGVMRHFLANGSLSDVS